VSQESQAVVVIRRPNSFLLGGSRHFVVSIDGQSAGRVKPRQVAEFPVSAGEHSLVVSIDWIDSRPLRITASPGTRTELMIGQRSGWVLKILLPMVLILIEITVMDTFGVRLQPLWLFGSIGAYIVATKFLIKDYWALYTLTPVETGAVVTAPNPH
jgi:hypothetical protein